MQALTRSQAVSEAPGVSSVNTSFQLILALAFLVVAVVIGFFFLILTVQKQSTLTVLRAVGAPTSYLVKALLKQIALVVGIGLVVGVRAHLRRGEGRVLRAARLARAGAR